MERIYNRRKFVYRMFLYMILIMTGVAIRLVYQFCVVDSVPDRILLRKGQEETISFDMPVSATINVSREEMMVSELSAATTEAMAATTPSYQKTDRCLKTPVATSVSITAGDSPVYTMDLKYMGIFPLKSVELNTVSGQEIFISGMPVGIYVKTKGVFVIDTGSFVSLQSEKVSPSESALQPGDNILRVNGNSVTGKRQFVDLIEDCEGEEMVLTILRNGEKSKVRVVPCQNEEGVYKLGVWVRDSAQGIGTLSYITKDGHFAALGHGVNDADVGSLMCMKRGSIYETSILAVKWASDSAPGELTGVLTYDENDYVGKINDNTREGIYGELSLKYLESARGQEFLGDCVSYPVALKQEIKKGPAQIYCCLEEAPAFYDVEISDVIYNPTEINRGIMLTITDEKLLQMTGGIVQGMSGSPIVQDGKVVGAVTHVLVRDSTRGYGIFIEEMLVH